MTARADTHAPPPKPLDWWSPMSPAELDREALRFVHMAAARAMAAERQGCERVIAENPDAPTVAFYQARAAHALRLEQHYRKHAGLTP